MNNVGVRAFALFVTIAGDFPSIAQAQVMMTRRALHVPNFSRYRPTRAACLLLG